MGDTNTVVNANSVYRHLQQYCSHPSICHSAYIWWWEPSSPSAVCGALDRYITGSTPHYIPKLEFFSEKILAELF